MTKLTEDEIQAFRDEHKRILVIDYQDHEIVMRKPKGAEYRRFRDVGSDPKRRIQASEDLAKSMIVSPDRIQVDAIQEEYPAFLQVLAEHAMELAGIVQADIRKIAADARTDIELAGECLLDFRDGEDSYVAIAGSMLVGEFMTSVIALVEAIAKRK